jgi:hypothetical protein
MKKVIERINEIKEKALPAKLSVCSPGSSLDITPTPEVSEVDAKYMLKLLNQYENSLRYVLYMFHLLSAWLPLGYDNFKAFVGQEFGEEYYQRFRRYLKNAEVLANVAGADAIHLPYVDAALTPLSCLTAKQQKKVWKALQKDCGKKSIPPQWLKAKKVLEKIHLLYPASDNVKPLEQALTKKQKRDLEFKNSLSKLAPTDKRYKFLVVKRWLKHYGPDYEAKLLSYLKEREAKKSAGGHHED